VPQLFPDKSKPKKDRKLYFSENMKHLNKPF
jgi:hypothetical protein